MTDSEDDEPSLKEIKLTVPLLKKNRIRDCLRWWPLFKACAMQKGFLVVINKTKCVGLPSVEQKFDEGKPLAMTFTKEEKKALAMNKMGITAFILAFKDNKTDDCMSYVNASMTDEWPSGQCWSVVSELLDEFAPDDSMGKLEQRQAPEKMSMRKHDNPKTLFTQATAIEHRFRERVTPLTEEEKMCTIMLRAPESYQAIIHNARQLLKLGENREPAMKELRTAMFDHYRMSKKAGNTNRKELTLFAGDDDEDSSEENNKKKAPRSRKNKSRRNNGNKVKRCYECGSTGHIKRDCPRLKAKKKAICKHCEKKGHTEDECWEKHPEKMPKWAKNKFKASDKETDAGDEAAGIMMDGETMFSSFEDEESSEGDYDPFDDCHITLGQQSPDRSQTFEYEVSSSTTCNANNRCGDNSHCKVIEEENSTEDREKTRTDVATSCRSPERTRWNDVRTFDKHDAKMPALRNDFWYENQKQMQASTIEGKKSRHDRCGRGQNQSGMGDDKIKTTGGFPLESTSKPEIGADTNPNGNRHDGKMTESIGAETGPKQGETKQETSENSELSLVCAPMDPEGHKEDANRGATPWSSNQNERGCGHCGKNLCGKTNKTCRKVPQRAESERRRFDLPKTRNSTANAFNCSTKTANSKFCRKSAELVNGVRYKQKWHGQRLNDRIPEQSKWNNHAPRMAHQRVNRNGWRRAPTETCVAAGPKAVSSVQIIVETHTPDGKFRRKFEAPERMTKYFNSRRCQSPCALRERARHEKTRMNRMRRVDHGQNGRFRNNTVKARENRFHAQTRAKRRTNHKSPQRGKVNNDHEILLSNVETALSETSGADMLHSPDCWVGDTGASCHSTNSKSGGTSARDAVDRLKQLRDSLDASGNSMKTKAIADIKGTICNNNGNMQDVQMKDVRCGASKFNLCSLTKMTDNGWKMTMDRTGIHLRKQKEVIHFDAPIKTPEGRIWAVKTLRRGTDGEGNETALATPTEMNLEKAHECCGHDNLRETKRTAKHLGWRLTRTPFHRCEACAIGKARQAKLGKGETNPPRTIGELWCIDGMKLKKPKRGRFCFPRNNCLELAVEHLTGSAMVGWHTSKSAFIEPFCSEFDHLRKRHRREVKRIRCDDAGENKSFRRALNGRDWRTPAAFEFTAKTPQANSRAETKIFTLCNKTRAMMQAANIPALWRHVVFMQFLRCCAQVDMLALATINGATKTRCEHLTGRLPRWVQHMQTAGMAGVVKTHKPTSSKVDARGKTCVFVGHAMDHAHDCCVMCDPVTESVLHSRDVLWLNRMHFPKPPRPDRVIHDASEEGSATQEDSSVATVSVDADDERYEVTSDSDDSSVDDSTDSSHETENENENESSANEAQEDTRPIGHVARSGRAMRAPRMHDGTERGLANVEITAAAIEEDHIDETCRLGIEEACRINHPYGDTSLREEECVLFSLTKGEKTHKSVERAFGCVRNGEHHLVAATLEDERGEIFLVGATGHNYGNTAELDAMTHKEAMATVDRKEWEKAVETEHEKMKKCNVFKAVHHKKAPKGTKLFDSTWAMKKKADGTFRARNAMRGFMQVDGQHYNAHDKSSPVATEIAIKITFVITMTAEWCQHLVDVEGAFLNGVFQHPEKHKTHMKVPEACKRWYPSWAALLLMKTQYGTIQAALQHYRECCKALEFLRFKRNEAEPCMFYKWEDKRLVLFLLWVDDCCVCGPKDLAEKVIEEFTSLWDCKDIGELKEYVGCKVERTPDWMKLTQPVKVRRFQDEFGCKGDDGPSDRAPTTPAEPGSVLEFDKDKEPCVSDKQQTKYRSGVGILLHMMRWSRPDVLNAVRELSSYMQKAGKQCMKALWRVMNFIIATKDKGLMFRPINPGGWKGTKHTYEFTVMGKCDSEYAKHSCRRSVNAGITYLEGAIVKQFSKMMPIVALSTTEAELYSAVLTAQDMMFVFHILEGLELKVKLPMILYCDNKGAVDLANNWSVGGRTRHTGTKMNFLRELKEKNILRVKWRSGENLTPDMHTKNVTKKLFDQYSQELVG